jgi:PAS domain S-box-containing protein
MDPKLPAGTSFPESLEIIRKQIGDLHISLRLPHNQTDSPIQQELVGLQRLIDKAVLGVYRSTVDGKLVMANMALARIFGYDSPEEMMESVTNIGTQLYVEPEGRKAWCLFFQNQEMIGPVFWQGHRNNHELLWLEEHAQVIRDGDGHILGYEGVVLDVTERYTQEPLSQSFEQMVKRVEETDSTDGVKSNERLRQELADAQQMIATLREQLDRFHVAAMGSQEGLWEAHPLPDQPWDSPETPAWYSAQFKALLGFEEHEFPPVLASWSARLHPDDREKVFKALKDHIEHHVPYEVESRLKTKQGEYRWFKGKGEAIFDEQGTFVRGGGTIRDITDQKEAGEAVKRKHVLLKTVVEGTSDIIFVKDHEGRYLLVNTKGAEVLRLPIEEIIGRTDAELFPNGTHPLFTKYDDAVIRERTPQSFEVDVEDGGAVSRTFLVTKEIFVQTEEWLEGLFCIARDITFRKGAELTIQEREKRYRAIMENAYDLIAEVDGSATFLYVSPNFEEVLGYAPSQLIGSNIFSLVHPEDRAGGLEEFTQGMQAAGSGRSIYRYRHQNGEYRWFESTGRLFQTALGDVRGVVVSRDITERKKSEEALQESQERYRVLYDEAPLMYFTVDAHLRILSVNKFGANMLGYTNEELVGQSAMTVVDPEDQEIFCREIEAGFTSMNQASQKVFRKIKKDGTRLWVRETSRSIVGPNQEQMLLLSCEDITDQKRVEDALEQSEKQLRQRQKMEAIGTLAGGIAHDFNNILGAILGYSELAMTQAKQEPKLISYLEEVLTAGHRAKGLVKQILAFSRRSDQEREAVDLNVMVEEALRMVRATLPTTIAIRSTSAIDSAVVFADPTQIHQVIMNVCANAEQAMRKQGGVLTLTVTSIEVTENSTKQFPELKPGTYLQLTIQDSGQGVSGQDLERIFEPFFTTKSSGEGTGLGLAVVHGIIVGHGGHIAVSSVVGQGTTFTILLPRLDVVLPAQIVNAMEWPQGRGNVLFVDDEEVLARWGEQVLTHLGYTVVTKTNPHDAVELFHKQPDQFDVVVTDQTMPTMSGEALAMALLEIRHDIPIVLCTGFSHTMSAEKANKIGLKGFLMKPVNGAGLAKTLQEVLEVRAR